MTTIEGAMAPSTPAATAVDALVETVREAASARTPLVIRGAGSKGWYGHRIDGEAIDVRALAGVVDYEPTELVITARAGTPLAEIEALLERERQMLAFEPPRFATGRSAATVGGCVAAGIAGPRRMAAGAVRDFVLGARLIDGRGDRLAFGGRVMKNVAGYDVSRALVGSLGTLGIVTEVSLKVLPKPVQSMTLSFTLDEAAALDQLNRWAGQPVAITAAAWHSDVERAEAAPYSARRGRLTVRLEGSEAAVQSGIRRIGGIDLEPADAHAFWHGVREQTDVFFDTRPVSVPLWRIALPPTAPPLDAVALGFDDQLIEWGGGLRWIAARADAARVREAATARGGHATLWRAADDVKLRHGVFTPLAPALAAIHRRLKREFDPHGIFNRGRMYPDL